MKWLIAVVISIASMGVGGAKADEKKPEPKPEAKGKLTLDGKAYELKNALAYETTKFDKKRTVVYLSEKPLDAAKLKASFKKKGSDEDFFAFDPTSNWSLMTRVIYSRSPLRSRANDILQGTQTSRAKRDQGRRCKGMAKSIKPDKE